MTTTAIRKSRGESRIRMLREVNGVPDGWMTTGGAVEYLGLSYSAIHRAYDTGKLEGRKFGELLCFTKEMLDAFDAERRNLSLVHDAPCTATRSP